MRSQGAASGQRETLQVLHLREEVPPDRTLKEAPVQSHGGETLQLPGVWAELHVSGKFQSTSGREESGLTLIGRGVPSALSFSLFSFLSVSFFLVSFFLVVSIFFPLVSFFLSFLVVSVSSFYLYSSSFLFPVCI